MTFALPLTDVAFVPGAMTRVLPSVEFTLVPGATTWVPAGALLTVVPGAVAWVCRSFRPDLQRTQFKIHWSDFLRTLSGW